MTNTRIDLSTVDFLVIDDNVFIRGVMREILYAFGARDVREAATVAEAFALVESRAPDIIFCDWMMRPLDGLHFLKALRSGRWSRIPVIMVTGYATPDHVAAAMGDGADSYIAKPFRAATLLDHIVKVVEATENPVTPI